MNSAGVYNSIRNTVQAHLPGARVVLFGSQARSERDRYSDYDLLIITPETFALQGKIDWSSPRNRAIVNAIHDPVDILLNSEKEIRRKQKLPDHIIRSVIREGIDL